MARDRALRDGVVHVAVHAAVSSDHHEDKLSKGMSFMWFPCEGKYHWTADSAFVEDDVDCMTCLVYAVNIRRST